MLKPISYEDACKIEPHWPSDLDIKNSAIIKEASENGACILVEDLCIKPTKVRIIYKDDSLGGDYVGFYIVPEQTSIDIWAAIENQGNLRSSVSICRNIDPNASLSECIAKARDSANKCPTCGKIIPLRDQYGYSFAGRCCKDCLPKMKAEHEQPGWYN